MLSCLPHNCPYLLSLHKAATSLPPFYEYSPFISIAIMKLLPLLLVRSLLTTVATAAIIVLLLQQDDTVMDVNPAVFDTWQLCSLVLSFGALRLLVCCLVCFASRTLATTHHEFSNPYWLIIFCIFCVANGADSEATEMNIYLNSSKVSVMPVSPELLIFIIPLDNLCFKMNTNLPDSTKKQRCLFAWQLESFIVWRLFCWFWKFLFHVQNFLVRSCCGTKERQESHNAKVKCLGYILTLPQHYPKHNKEALHFNYWLVCCEMPLPVSCCENLNLLNVFLFCTCVQGVALEPKWEVSPSFFRPPCRSCWRSWIVVRFTFVSRVFLM